MTPIILASLIGGYILSFLLFLGMTYLFKKFIDIQSIFISILPVVNTFSLFVGMLSALIVWYRLNKNKVLIDGRVKKQKKPTKNKQKIEIPIPKV